MEGERGANSVERIERRGQRIADGREQIGEADSVERIEDNRLTTPDTMKPAAP